MNWRNVVRQANFYVLEIVAMSAALTNFAWRLNRSKDWWNLTGDNLSFLVFLGTIVASIAVIRRAVAELARGLERGQLFTRNVARPRTITDLLNYVCGIGAFGQDVDPQFWVKYVEVLEQRPELSELQKIDMFLSAIDQRKFIIHPDAVYYLMHELVKRVAKRGETYFATSSIPEIVAADRDPAAGYFLFELPLRFPQSIKRIVYVQDQRELKALDKSIRDRLVVQIDKGVKLYCSSTKDRMNYGVYGATAVGIFNEATRSNELDFNREVVVAYRDRFVAALEGPTTVRLLTRQDLEDLPPS
jgi:hypothetical protein